MAEDRVRIGVLGAANIARKNVAGILKADNVEVVAVGSRTKSKAEKFINDTNISGTAKAYGSYEEVLNLPNVDAVYLPLPTAVHLEFVKKAAAAKKHILLEKPIALSANETDEIINACEEAGVQFMDGTMFVHNPRFDKFIRAAISDRKELGKLVSVSSLFTWKADDSFFGNDVRTKKDGDALGCYGDVGWYCIKAALWVFDFEKPVSVQAHPGPKFNEERVVMHGGATIIWADGKRLTFDCGFDAVHSMYLQIAGEQGMIEIQDFCIPYRPDESPYYQKGPASWHDSDTRIEQKIEKHQVSLEKPQESYMWETFANCIKKVKSGQKPVSKWADEARICSKLCVAVEQSAQEGGKLIDVSSWL